MELEFTNVGFMPFHAVISLPYHRCGPFDEGDVLTLFLEEQYTLGQSLPKKIARTKTYTPEMLWRIQSKQGIDKSEFCQMFSCLFYLIDRIQPFAYPCFLPPPMLIPLVLWSFKSGKFFQIIGLKTW
jgi:hypothetical protein